MGRIQNVVLIAAGVATAGLFGISITDIQGCSRAGELNKNSAISPDERIRISRKVKIQSVLNNRSIPSEQFDLIVESYAKNLKEAKAAGLGVSDKELSSFIIENFGEKDAYLGFLSAMKQRHGLKTSELENFFRDQMLFSKQAKLTMLGDYVTETEIKAEFHKRNDRLTYDRLEIDAKTITLEANPSEDELKAYYEENSSSPEYQVPEKVAISYLMINPKNIPLGEFSATDIEQHYNLNKSSYSSSGNADEAPPLEEIKEKVVEDLGDESRDNKAKRLLNGLDDIFLEQENIDLLTTLAEQSSSDNQLSVVESGTTEPFAEKDYLVEPLGYVFNLGARLFGENPRVYGGVLEAGNGFYIYHLQDRTPARAMSFEEAKDIASNALTEQLQLEIAEAKALEWQEKLNASGNWSALELEESMSYRQKSAVGLSSPETRELKNAKANDPVATITSGSKVVLMRLVEREAADESTIDSEKESLRQALQQNKSYLMMSGLR